MERRGEGLDGFRGDGEREREVGTHATHSLTSPNGPRTDGGTDERKDGVRDDREMRLLFGGGGAIVGRGGGEGRKEGTKEGEREGRLKGGPSFCSSRVSHAMTQMARGGEKPGRKEEGYMYTE